MDTMLGQSRFRTGTQGNVSSTIARLSGRLRRVCRCERIFPTHAESGDDAGRDKCILTPGQSGKQSTEQGDSGAQYKTQAASNGSPRPDP